MWKKKYYFVFDKNLITENIPVNINLFCEENGNNLNKAFQSIWKTFGVKLGIITVLKI